MSDYLDIFDLARTRFLEANGEGKDRRPWMLRRVDYLSEGKEEAADGLNYMDFFEMQYCTHAIEHDPEIIRRATSAKHHFIRAFEEICEIQRMLERGGE